MTELGELKFDLTNTINTLEGQNSAHTDLIADLQTSNEQAK